MLSVVMLSAILLNVIMLSVVGPSPQWSEHGNNPEACPIIFYGCN
jgi:hypothetical protein